MKKIVFYLIVFILICFIMPAMLTKRTALTAEESNGKNEIDEINSNNVNKNNLQQTEDKNNNFESIENYQYNKYGSLSLLHKKTGEVEQVSLDEYLYNVVSAEMPADYELEALKAQAIVARTYTIFKILNKKHQNADICDDSTCCQAWISKNDRLARWEESRRDSNWKKICDVVDSTKGKIIIYENKPINAFFHSNSGGKTEIPVNVWGGSGYPYLQSVETSGEDAYSQYSSEIVFSQEDLLNRLKDKYNDIVINFNNADDVKIIEFTENIRVKTVKFGNKEISGVEARQILGLRSTNFEIIRDGNNIKFSVKGYGHGVGMSQTGADSMAKKGANYNEIIKHFYTGVEIGDVNSI